MEWFKKVDAPYERGNDEGSRHPMNPSDLKIHSEATTASGQEMASA